MAGGSRPPAARPLPRKFYARSTLVVARALIGRLLVHEAHGTRVSGRIVEVEAYGGARDPASHAFRGETARNRTMFGSPGHAYLYVSYGMHHCLNVVTGRAGLACAVLIRALAPVEGLPTMARRRGVSDPHRLTRGPGCVAQALGLTLDHDGADLTRSPLWVADLPVERFGRRIVRGPRIGISRAADWEWRLFLDGHPCVSDPGVARRAGSGGKAPRRGSAVAGRARHPADRGIAPSSR